jgi:hypothetical protein
MKELLVMKKSTVKRDHEVREREREREREGERKRDMGQGNAAAEDRTYVSDHENGFW